MNVQVKRRFGHGVTNQTPTEHAFDHTPQCLLATNPQVTAMFERFQQTPTLSEHVFGMRSQRSRSKVSCGHRAWSQPYSHPTSKANPSKVSWQRFRRSEGVFESLQQSRSGDPPNPPKLLTSNPEFSSKHVTGGAFVQVRGGF